MPFAKTPRLRFCCWRGACDRAAAETPCPTPSRHQARPSCSPCTPKARRYTNARPAQTASSPGRSVSRSRHCWPIARPLAGTMPGRTGTQRRQRRRRQGRRQRAGRDTNDIPWLKLSVVSSRGSGILTGVTTVQRINTQGGKLDGACDKAGSFRSAPYSAEYVFLRKP